MIDRVTPVEILKSMKLLRISESYLYHQRRVYAQVQNF